MTVWISYKNTTRHSILNFVKSSYQEKVKYLISYATERSAVALYNRRSGGWLAMAVVPRCKLVVLIVRAIDFGPAVMQPTGICYAQLATLRLHPVIHVPNYMDYYSLTNPWGMDGWVGHVGWPIADVWPTKWSSIQLAVCHRIGKVHRPRPAFYPLCYAAKKQINKLLKLLKNQN